MTEREYIAATYSFVPFGSQRFRLLLSYFKSAKNIWNANISDLAETGLSRNMISNFDKYRKRFDMENYFKNLKYLKIKFLTISDKKYPPNILGQKDAPYVLYYKGNLLSRDSKSIAVVGSRRMTPYGKEATEMFSKKLVRAGFTIISGLARGVDTVAHRSALDAGGRTIAILGNGLGRVYPPENKNLADDIIESRGAVISEYPPSYPPYPENFISRNRIVSGLSLGVVVIEGAQRSGTLVTASHAAEQGKIVFAVPGPITSPTSFAPNFLIRNGAKIITSVSDILEEINL